MNDHIGIVACSAEGAALCYRTIAAEGTTILGRHAHPEVTMHTHALSTYMERIEADDWNGVADLMASSAEKVAKAGADFIVCPDNTIHRAFDRAASKSPRPWLHIAEVVADEAARRGFKRVAVLGTRYTMDGPVYPQKLGARRIDHRVPDADDRAAINRIIFDELVNAEFTDPARAYFVGVIARMKEAGCDAVALACTEIPLLIDESMSPLPTLDSTRLLARAALWRATGKGGS
jgi:aspartate racemase